MPEVGPFHLTMTAKEALQAARAFAEARIIPLHHDGWAHFSEGAKEVAAAFELAGMSNRLRWGEPGNAVAIEL